MKYTLTGIDLSFSLGILIFGLKHFKNTISTYKNIKFQNNMTGSVYSIAVDSVFISIFILISTWLNNSKVDFLVDVLLPSFIIVGGIESFKYLFLNLQSNQFKINDWRKVRKRVASGIHQLSSSMTHDVR
ncbi:hypothetical protein [Bacillus cereus]